MRRSAICSRWSLERRKWRIQVGIVVYQLAKMRMCSFAMIVSTISSIERILSSSRWTPTTCILGSQAKRSKKRSGRSFSKSMKWQYRTDSCGTNGANACGSFQAGVRRNSWDNPMQKMLLHGERRKEQSQTVIEGYVHAVEQAHTVLIRGIVELSRGQSRKPGVPDGERHYANIYPK